MTAKNLTGLSCIALTKALYPGMELLQFGQPGSKK